MRLRFAEVRAQQLNWLTRRLHTELLEPRLFLHGDAIDEWSPSSRDLLASTDANDWAIFDYPVPSDTGDGSLAEAIAGSATYALSSVPILNSLAGAAVSLYLNFVGHFDATWGGYTNITTPAFDQDGDATTFSDGELATIYDIWQGVAEDYAPFKVNVTTVAPSSFANGVALLAAIGGDGAWIGGTYGGVAYVNSFTNSQSNTVFVFAKNLGNGYAKYIADAVSHETGHAFGLQHQAQYSSTGAKIAEYYAGPGDGTAPIMGYPFSAPRTLWWYGTTAVSSTTYQDDMAIISRSTNGFGYRADDHGNTASSASALTVSGDQLTGSGIITTTSDLDYFSFSSLGGQVTFSIDVGAYANLDLRAELRDANDALIASASPSNSFGATISATLATGSYRLVVTSSGGYGNVGQYKISGSVVIDPNAVYAPSNLIASTQNGRVALAWIDNATNETAYYVARSADGANWSTVADLAADRTSFVDINVSAGVTYFYRVWAANGTNLSDYTPALQVWLAPAAPTGLLASAVSAGQIGLSWNDVSGETGYRIERSSNGGSTWSQVATVDANATTYQDSGLSSSTTYTYRVVATNLGGSSAASNWASATTLGLPAAPAAPSGLTAATGGVKQVNLSWNDNSNNESGFRIERSSNNGKSWSVVTQVGSDVTSYADNSVSGRKTYTYRVRAFNDGGNSAWSNLAKVTTPKYIPPPVAAPSDLSAVVTSAQQIELSWNDNSDNESGFRIERSTNGRKWKQIATIGQNTTTLLDASVVPSKSYSYRVRAYGEAGNTAYANVAQAAAVWATPAAIGVPSCLPRGVVLASDGAPAHAELVPSCFVDEHWVDSLVG